MSQPDAAADPSREASSPRLSLSSLERVPAEFRPELDPRALTVGIVHLGIGAFHRAHAAVYTERASVAAAESRWGICGVSERGPHAAVTLTEQDGLYSVAIAGGAGAGGDGSSSSPLRVMASLREALFAQASPSAVVERIADPATSIVSLTVTEKGYRHDPSTGRLRGDDAEVAADAGGRPPVTVVGQLARGLEARRRVDAGPVTVLSCDNLPSNGSLLAGLVRDLMGWPGGAFDDGLEEWIAECVRFPCSMVDRIVPGTTAAVRAAVAERLGVLDEAAVTAEPFSQWVLEDDFAGERPAWERAGVEIVGDVAPYETLKLRVLNGTHSAIAYFGVLAGVETIAEALALHGLAEFVLEMIDLEVGPTLVLPRGVSLARYRDQVLERFANAELHYRCSQVASDGSQKLGQRLLAVIRWNLANGTSPRRATLVVAAWISSLLRTSDDRDRPLEVSDPLADRLRALVGEASNASVVAARVLGLREVFGDELAGDEAFHALLAEQLRALEARRTTALLASFSR
jgi:fructuronate reductase